MKENAISIKNLKKEYKMYHRKRDRLVEALIPICQRHDTFAALQDFNLELKQGEILGVLGKNGAGKSTLLKMITGVVTPTSGEIQVKGKISSLLELGTAFNMELTGMENIYQHGQVMGLTKEQIEKTKEEVIEFADIGDHLYQPVKTYSSGMFARLAFACAINVDPDILIVDEVLSVGDMAFQLKCFKKFQQFKERGKTILFVTHNVADILKNCTRTIILDKGKKIFDGSVKDGVERYKKIIVGISDEEEKQETSLESLVEDQNQTRKNNQPVTHVSQEKTWKAHFDENPDLISYGNGMAEVIDYGIFNTENKYLKMIENDREILLRSKVEFFEKVNEPIFTMTIKDFNGIEITGTNTMFEKIATGSFEKGDIVEVEFRQVLNLAPGKYTLSFSCTHFNEKGDLEVLSRKYDALLIEILSMKECVGFMRLNSDIKITKTKREKDGKEKKSIH